MVQITNANADQLLDTVKITRGADDKRQLSTNKLTKQNIYVSTKLLDSTWQAIIAKSSEDPSFKCFVGATKAIPDGVKALTSAECSTLAQQIQPISAQDLFNRHGNQLYVYGNAHHPAAIVDGKFVSPELSYLVTHLSPMQEDQLLKDIDEKNAKMFFVSQHVLETLTKHGPLLHPEQVTVIDIAGPKVDLSLQWALTDTVKLRLLLLKYNHPQMSDADILYYGLIRGLPKDMWPSNYTNKAFKPIQIEGSTVTHLNMAF